MGVFVRMACREYARRTADRKRETGPDLGPAFLARFATMGDCTGMARCACVGDWPKLARCNVLGELARPGSLCMCG
jgi:hypothetical protein